MPRGGRTFALARRLAPEGPSPVDPLGIEATLAPVLLRVGGESDDLAKWWLPRGEASFEPSRRWLTWPLITFRTLALTPAVALCLVHHQRSSTIAGASVDNDSAASASDVEVNGGARKVLGHCLLLSFVFGALVAIALITLEWLRGMLSRRHRPQEVAGAVADTDAIVGADAKEVRIGFASYYCLYGVTLTLLALAATCGVMEAAAAAERPIRVVQLAGFWLGEALGVHLLCAATLLWRPSLLSSNRSGMPAHTHIGGPRSFALRAALSLAPLQERADCLRHAIVLGLFICARTLPSYVCVAVMLACGCFLFYIVLADDAVLLAMRRIYWPLACPYDLEHPEDDQQPCRAVFEESSLRRWESEFLPEEIHGSMSIYVLGALAEITQEKVKRLSMISESVSMCCCIVFLLSEMYLSRSEPLIIASVILSMCKLYLVQKVRPYVLCWIAAKKRVWREVTPDDVTSSTSCQDACTWQVRYWATSKLLEASYVTPAIRNAAILALGHMFEASEGIGTEGWEKAGATLRYSLLRFLEDRVSSEEAKTVLLLFWPETHIDELKDIYSRLSCVMDVAVASSDRARALDGLSSHPQHTSLFVTLVLRSLDDEDEEVRASAVRVLASVGSLSGAHSKDVVRCLQDSGQSVRSAALASLENLRAQGAHILVDVAEGLNSENMGVRLAAIQALTAFGDEAKSFAPELARCLEDAEMEVVLAAMAALRQLGTHARTVAETVARLLRRGTPDALRDGVSYRYFRFVPEESRGRLIYDGVHVSELVFFRNGQQVVTLGASATTEDLSQQSSAASSSTTLTPQRRAFVGCHRPANAIDGNPATKWESTTVRQALVVAFPSQVTIDHYTFRTALDSASKDPARWRLEGSHDGRRYFGLHFAERAACAERGTLMTPYCSLTARLQALEVLSRLDTEALVDFCGDIARCVRDDDPQVCLAALALAEGRLWGPQHKAMLMPEVELKLRDGDATIRRAAQFTMRSFGVAALETMRNCKRSKREEDNMTFMTGRAARTSWRERVETSMSKA